MPASVHAKNCIASSAPSTKFIICGGIGECNIIPHDVIVSGGSPSLGTVFLPKNEQRLTKKSDCK